MIKQFVCFFAGLWLCTGSATGQPGAKISSDELKYDFGTIAEENGPVSHTFVIKNTGDAPLVITNAAASCGCTRPEWTKAPIAPGAAGEVKVTYDPAGRPGPFIKNVYIYSNAQRDAFLVAIKGNVTPKRPKPVIIYPYAIGKLKLDTKKVLYSSIRPDEALAKKISVVNSGDTPMRVRLKKHPDYLDIQMSPAILHPGETGEISLLLNAAAVKKPGRILAEIPVFVAKEGQKRETEGFLTVAANLIDDFSRLTEMEKTDAPVIALPTDHIDFGSLKGRGGKVSRRLEIANRGRSPLSIHSITCDDGRVDIGGGKREIKPGATATFKITVRPKEIKTALEDVINVISTDPANPVRLIKVTAKP